MTTINRETIGISPDTIMKTVSITDIPLNMVAIYDNNVDDLPVYIGRNEIQALTSDPTWVIVKNTFSGQSITQQEALIGSWDNRGSLAWR